VSQVEHLDLPPKALWNRILAEPDRAPEHIALAAAKRFGPAAAYWARVAGPGKTPPKLAKTAVTKHVRLARLEGATLGWGGAVTIAPDLVALLWIQSRMVFYVAAAHGHDPLDRMRPAELLVLRDLYPDPGTARRALDGLGATVAEAYVGSKLQRDEALATRLAFMVGKRGIRRMAGRLIPGFAIMFNAVANERDTRRLADRCIEFYGG
jgi:hypothetical protein